MEIKNKLFFIILLIFTVFNFKDTSLAQTIIHDNFKDPIRIDCEDGVYINFDSSTFNEPVEISCKKNNYINDLQKIEYLKSPVYILEITSLHDGKKFNFFRKEATINFPKNLLDLDNDNQNQDQSVFFYDFNIKDWVTYNTTHTNNYLQAKLMYVGNFAVFDKIYNTNIDIYRTISFYIIVVGIGASIIYVIIKK